MLRSRLVLGADIVLIMMATVAAQLLRDNLEWSAARFESLAPYMVATGLFAISALLVSGLSRSIWRFSSLPDYQRIVFVVLVVVLGATGSTFAWNRLDGVSRSLPILQGLLAVAFMVGSRIAFRLWWLQRHARKAIATAPLTRVVDRPVRSVLMVGLNRLTETYLQSLAEFEPGRIRIVGILGRAARHVGRLAGTQRVLGVPEDIAIILRDLEVHGVAVDRIVVTTRLADMSEEARAALLDVEEAGGVELQFLSEVLSFDHAVLGHPSQPVTKDDSESSIVSFEIPTDRLEAISRRRYWKFKRTVDTVAAALLLVIAAPVMLIVAVLIGVYVGVPVTFWQQRPGLGGVPFRLHKFRTMSAAHAPDGRRRSDEERTSQFGNFLRRTRLDELPQLISILRGDMSFIGPRPLLPRDQAAEHRARLLVRPGLTGWAQVVGGRIISAEDKAALDIWYVKHASIRLDIEIVMRTIRMVVWGERVSETLVNSAWRDLDHSGVLRGNDALLRSRSAA